MRSGLIIAALALCPALVLGQAADSSAPAGATPEEFPAAEETIKLGIGELCQDADECFTGFCVLNVCAISPYGGFRPGQACQANINCVTYACIDGVCGFPTLATKESKRAPASEKSSAEAPIVAADSANPVATPAGIRSAFAGLANATLRNVQAAKANANSEKAEDASTAPSSKSSANEGKVHVRTGISTTNLIIGAVVGSTAAIALIALLVHVYVKRNRDKRDIFSPKRQEDESGDSDLPVYQKQFVGRRPTFAQSGSSHNLYDESRNVAPPPARQATSSLLR